MEKRIYEVPYTLSSHHGPENCTIMLPIIKENCTIILCICGPRIFGYYAFPTKKARLVFLFKTKKPFLENGLESPLIFVFILKGKTK